MCFSRSSFTLTVFAQPDELRPMVDLAPLAGCDDENTISAWNDGFANFDLAARRTEILSVYTGTAQDGVFEVSFHATEQQAIDGILALPDTFENTLASPQPIWVKIYNPNKISCNEIGMFELQVIQSPELTGWLDREAFCENIGMLEIGPEVDPMNPNYTYSWTGPSGALADTSPIITILEAGMYSLTVTNTDPVLGVGCDRTYEIDVFSSTIPVITGVDVRLQIEGNFSNTIEVAVQTPTFPVSYEYKLDHGPWQDSNIFDNVQGGEHFVTVRDVNGCGEDVERDIFVIDYPRFFTPNGDGYNDSWNPTAIFTKTTARIYIFDRYGKLMKQLSPVDTGWDGTINGAAMPSGDYWFRFMYPRTDGSQQEVKGHFSLKR